jgi:hypothetical protein
MSTRIVTIFGYRFEVSSDARVKWGSIGVSFSLCIRSLEFYMLNALGEGVRWLAFCVKYAGVLRQITIGQIGWSGLCSFIRPLIVGAEGFMLMYLHLVSCGMSVCFSDLSLVGFCGVCRYGLELVRL